MKTKKANTTTVAKEEDEAIQILSVESTEEIREAIEAMNCVKTGRLAEGLQLPVANYFRMGEEDDLIESAITR